MLDKNELQGDEGHNAQQGELHVEQQETVHVTNHPLVVQQQQEVHPVDTQHQPIEVKPAEDQPVILKLRWSRQMTKHQLLYRRVRVKRDEQGFRGQAGVAGWQPGVVSGRAGG